MKLFITHSRIMVLADATQQGHVGPRGMIFFTQIVSGLRRAFGCVSRVQACSTEA
jgi:hypothetical protein